MEKILVIGCAGQIGSELTLELRKIYGDSNVVAAGSCNLTDKGRKAFIAAFERRMGHEVTHPIFKYRISYRRLLEVQARLLVRFLAGEISEYPCFTTR